MIIEPVPVEEGCFRAGQTEDHWVDLVLLLFGQCDVVLVPKALPPCYEDRWSYPSLAAAVAALAAWDWPAEREPAGWHRHRPSDRRRTDGDPAREYVAP